MLGMLQASTENIAAVQMRGIGGYADILEINSLRERCQEPSSLLFCWTPPFPLIRGASLLWGAMASLGWAPRDRLHLRATGRDSGQISLHPLALGKCCTSPLSQPGFKPIPPPLPKAQPTAAPGTRAQSALSYIHNHFIRFQAHQI